MPGRLPTQMVASLAMPEDGGRIGTTGISEKERKAIEAYEANGLRY